VYSGKRFEPVQSKPQLVPTGVRYRSVSIEHRAQLLEHGTIAYMTVLQSALSLRASPAEALPSAKAVFCLVCTEPLTPFVYWLLTGAVEV
jgi:hypothetical protein